MATKEPESQQVNLADLITAYLLAEHVPVENVAYSDPRSRLASRVLGQYDNSTGGVSMFVHPVHDKGIYEYALAHELAHATGRNGTVGSRALGMWDAFGYNQMAEDLVSAGLLGKGDSGNRTDVKDIEAKALAKYKELKLPSHRANSFEEVRAELTAYRTLKELGVPIKKEDEDKYEAVLDTSPEFRYWMESGLGGRYVSTPRLKEPQTSTGRTAKPSTSTPEQRYSKDSFGLNLLKYLGVIREDES